VLAIPPAAESDTNSVTLTAILAQKLACLTYGVQSTTDAPFDSIINIEYR
jgi:hypothetical protein